LGFAGVVSFGAVGVAPPALDVDVPDPEELVVEGVEVVEVPLDAALDTFFAAARGVNGSRALPPCCFEVPLVVSETGRLGFTGAWLTATPATGEEAPVEEATGVTGVEEPPLCTA
jgi:hypothetical protein